jgi:hypothetical protein
MERQVQETGVRDWYGDDFLSIQNEVFSVLDNFFAEYGNMIISGCDVDGQTIAAGLVGLNGADGYKVCRFAGAQNVTVFPVYLYQHKEEITGEYDSGETKPIKIIYSARITNSLPQGEYVRINQNGTKTSFRDAIQTAAYRLVNDAMINNWNGIEARAASDATSKSNTVLNTLRGSIANDKNSLGKLFNWITQELVGKVNNLKDIEIDANTLSPTNTVTVIRALSGSTNLPLGEGILIHIKVHSSLNVQLFLHNNSFHYRVAWYSNFSDVAWNKLHEGDIISPNKIILGDSIILHSGKNSGGMFFDFRRKKDDTWIGGFVNDGNVFRTNTIEVKSLKIIP